MYHSIYFAPSPEVFQSGVIGGNAQDRAKVIDIWEDWHLVSSSRPLLLPPKPKTNYVDIPGGDGSLDLSEVLTGTPVYSNREGSWDLYVMNGYWDWTDAYSTIMNFLHGQKMCVVLEDDQAYYYEGRFTVNSWKSDPSYSRITINYNVDPYKYTVLQNDWYWNPFDFGAPLTVDSSSYANYLAEEHGYANMMGDTWSYKNGGGIVSYGDKQLNWRGAPIPNYEDMLVDGTLEIPIEGIGKHISPSFQMTPTSGTTDGVTVALIRPDGTSTDATSIATGGVVFIPDIVIGVGMHTLVFTGHGTVTMNYRGASL